MISCIYILLNPLWRFRFSQSKALEVEYLQPEVRLSPLHEIVGIIVLKTGLICY